MLTSIEIPNKVTHIGEFVFNNANKLTEIKVESGNNYYSSVDGVLFDINKTTLIQYPIGKIQYPTENPQTSYKIPNNVTSIGYFAFENTTNLQSIQVPISVIIIDPNAFTGSRVNTAVFESLTNLTTLGLKIGSGQHFYGATGVTISVIGQTDFTIVDGNPIVNYRQGIDIQGNLTLDSYNNKTALNNMKITLNNIQSVTVGANVSSIAEKAFQNANILQSITIPNTVTSIGDLAFQNTIKLTEIIVDPSNNKYLSDDSGVLFNKEKTALIQYPIGNTQTSYIIPDTVANISNNAFQNAKILQKITIPNTVTNIGDNAFQNATSLTTVTLSKDSKLQSIGAYAFDSATILESIYVPASVTSIGNYAFQSVKKLKMVTFAEESKLDSIGDYAFNYARGFLENRDPGFRYHYRTKCV